VQLQKAPARAAGAGGSRHNLGADQRGQASLIAHFGNRTRWRTRKRRVGSKFRRRTIDSTQSSFPNGLTRCADNRTAASSASLSGVLTRFTHFGIRRIDQGDSKGGFGSRLCCHCHNEPQRYSSACQSKLACNALLSTKWHTATHFS
jgi:hypothetical protein